MPIPYVKWTDYHDEVTIRFSPEIIPYLINLKKNFTQHALSDLAELNSKYSIILYRWLSMNYNQYEHYSYKGGRREEQVEAYRNPTISMRELREMTDTINDYKRFTHFETRVLKEPLEEINAHTSFNVSYDKIKKGEALILLSFISRKNVEQTITVISWMIRTTKKRKLKKKQMKKNLYIKLCKANILNYCLKISFYRLMK
ncbi:Replication protein RepB (plasmid) [Lactococcus lactis subsp. lactis]|nr:Replication protein RepB [Lactococcus lactis subsp. lactis]